MLRKTSTVLAALLISFNSSSALVKFEFSGHITNGFDLNREYANIGYQQDLNNINYSLLTPFFGEIVFTDEQIQIEEHSSQTSTYYSFFSPTSLTINLGGDVYSSGRTFCDDDIFASYYLPNPDGLCRSTNSARMSDDDLLSGDRLTIISDFMKLNSVQRSDIQEIDAYITLVGIQENDTHSGTDLFGFHPKVEDYEISLRVVAGQSPILPSDINFLGNINKFNRVSINEPPFISILLLSFFGVIVFLNSKAHTYR